MNNVREPWLPPQREGREDERRIIEWWSENYWRQIRRLHKAYANLGCVDEDGSAMNYTGDVGPKECTCAFCAEATNSHSETS